MNATAVYPKSMRSTPAPTPHADSEALLARARGGDDQAQETLIAKHEARVYALARAIVKDRASAEDATQETFLRVITRLPEFKDNSNAFDAWVLAIARNVALDQLRRRKVRGETTDDFERLELLNAGELANPSPLERLSALEDTCAAAQALESLPGIWREILVLRFYHDLQPAEAAKVLGVSPENARIRLWRALNELRTRLGGTPEAANDPKDAKR